MTNTGLLVGTAQTDHEHTRSSGPQQTDLGDKAVIRVGRTCLERTVDTHIRWILLKVSL
jgi:hypothetical protein